MCVHSMYTDSLELSLKASALPSLPGMRASWSAGRRSFRLQVVHSMQAGNFTCMTQRKDHEKEMLTVPRLPSLMCLGTLQGLY